VVQAEKLRKEVSEMPLRCPACRSVNMTPLVDRDINLEIDYCKTCKGLWFDYHEIREFLKSKKFKKIFLPEMVSATPHTDFYSITQKSRVCPRCIEKMDEKIHCGITFDFCGKCHGIWLDDGEINLIVQAYKKGKSGGDPEILKELEAGFKGDAKAMGSIFNIVAQFFREFFDSLGKSNKS